MTNSKIKGIEKVTRWDLANQFKQFVQQKPGFDLRNYSTTSSYKSDYNYYKKDADFNRRLDVLDINHVFNALTDEEIAHDVFDSRLYITEDGKIDYITGQYFPTEYQAAAKNTYEKAERIFKLKEKGEWN